MRLPRDVSGRDLSSALGALGYEVALRVGTLAGVVADVAAHHGLTREQVLERLFPGR
jgi:hypothetical protein